MTFAPACELIRDNSGPQLEVIGLADSVKVIRNSFV
jgi:hypothetical protein